MGSRACVVGVGVLEDLAALDDAPDLVNHERADGHCPSVNC